jgi:hypothetical protein
VSLFAARAVRILGACVAVNEYRSRGRTKALLHALRSVDRITQRLTTGAAAATASSTSTRTRLVRRSSPPLARCLPKWASVRRIASSGLHGR